MKHLTAILSFALCSQAFGGQSLSLVPGMTSAILTDPLLPDNQSWRVEFQIHNWVLPAEGFYFAYIFQLDGTGVSASIWPDGRLTLNDNRDLVARQDLCYLPLTGRSNVLVRFQRDVPGKTTTCELWNTDGTGYARSGDVISSVKAYPSVQGGTIGGAVSVKLGFFRIDRNLVPAGSKPPTTARSGEWTELKFDGGPNGLMDSSGNGHNAVLANPVYAATPNQGPAAIAKTSGAPTWSNWVSLRAGHPAQLDGASSFSLADASDLVTYQWEQVDGPTAVQWSDTTASRPTIEGLIFGTYRFRLRVLDAAGLTASADLELGAVSTDDNGVVVNADPNVDKIFGPMIAFGKNPWGFMDERSLAAMKLRKAAYEAQGITNPTWATNGQGTVSYTFAGTGAYPGSGGTRLCGGIPSATTTSITVCDASKLDLSELPTRILVGGAYHQEEIRIVAATETTGQATLTVAYDGRGQNGGAFQAIPAQAWPDGTKVGQYKITGTDTLFLTDPTTAICLAGAPGPPGRSVYAAGAISLAAGSAKATGTGTSWTVANKVIPTDFVRVSATHGGTPFVFVAPISNVDDATHLTLGRNYPPDADSGTFEYSVIAYRYFVVHYTRPDGSDGRVIQSANGCESETAIYGYAAHDYPDADKVVFSGMTYSYKDALGAQSAFGPNFYGEGLAHRALYYRSGLSAALTAANEIDEYWVKDPEVDGGWAGGLWLNLGGGAIGAITDLALNPNTGLDWSDVRHFATIGAGTAKESCSDDDSRDTGYAAAWLTLAALWDPDATQRSAWKTALRAVNTRDNNCRGVDPANPIINNSWANGSYWNSSGPSVKVTNGSAVVTAVNNDLASSMCHGIATVNVTVTNGSATFTGAGLVKGGRIVISGVKGSNRCTGFFEFTVASSSTGTLSVLWPGDSGTYSALIEDSTAYYDWYTSIAQSQNDPMLSENWACTYNSPSQLTLNRPWDGITDSTGANHFFRYVLAGKGQQPYMLGIKTRQMQWGSLVDDEEADNYASLASAAAQWIKDYGYDPPTQGLHYGRIFGACEPDTVPTPRTGFNSRTPNCNNGLDPGAIRIARVLTGEASAALGILYNANPTQANKEFGDVAYGSIWGYPPYTTGGAYSDGNYVQYETSDNALGAYKWTGFFFGMGAAHQWPAMRLGGVQPAAMAMAPIAFDLKRVPDAKSISVTVTQPSGARQIYSCTTSPCEIEVDRRQGAHWIQMKYLSRSGLVLSEEPSALLRTECRR